MTTYQLKVNIQDILVKQGFIVQPDGVFRLKSNDRESWRKVHEMAKVERIRARESFIQDNIKIIKKYLINGSDLNVSKISPKLKLIEPNSEEEIIYRWWNLAWWSLPYERAYGRQIRFLVWDTYHNAPIGLFGLQSPILKWAPRDNYLKIPISTRDYWVNQSLSAQRIGALPPYNDVLAGKLVAMLMTSNIVREHFEQKYSNVKTIMRRRRLPARLLFITTTGAYGKSSVYQRLKYHDEHVSKFIGFTNGCGTFHIPNRLYLELIEYLKKRGFNIRRGYGSGPSRKLILIDQALQLLGFSNGVSHGVKRAVYLFPMVRNLEEVIKNNKQPRYLNHTVTKITEFWKQRWALPRISRDQSFKEYVYRDFIEQLMHNLDQYNSQYN